MSEQQAWDDMKLILYNESLSDFISLIKEFGARQVMKDLQINYEKVWPEIYSAVVHKESKIPMLEKPWDVNSV